MGGRCVLSRADRAICDRDPGLAGLPLLLDAQAMAAALGCQALRPAYLRYKPGISCTAGFLRADGQALAAYAYPPDRYAEESRRSRWLKEPSVVMLPDHGMIVIPARLDRHLRGLRRVLDPDHRPKHLRRVVGVTADLTGGDLVLLRYKPGRRMVARIDLNGEPQAVLKVMRGTGFDRALIGATAAMAHGQAPLLGADSGLRALLTRWVPGQPVCPEMTGQAPGPAICIRIGQALAELHADPFRPAAAWTSSGDAKSVLTAAADMAPLDAELAARAAPIAADLAHRLGRSAVDATLVHGDFSADQVVISGQGDPVILDWDNAGCGDPARDLGSFLARMDAQVIDGLLTQNQANRLGAALLQGYGPAPDTLPLHHARALMLLLTEGFRARHLDWPARARSLLDRAERCLRGIDPPVIDPAMPQLTAALDTGRALAALSRATGMDLTGTTPELIRHKPGRRALVRYAAGDHQGAILGKLRAKGIDRRMPALHDALRGAGLDGHQGRTGVPQARGTVDTMNMWLQDEVPGSPPDPMDAGAMARIGTALAQLHDAPAATDRRWSHADELAVLDRALTQAAAQLPHDAGALQAILRGAADRLASLPPGPECGIHRDFYFDQVLVAEAQIWLVDLDLYAVGDPAIDLGNFLAHLDEFALRGTGDVAAAGPAAQAFLAGYTTRRALPDAPRIRLFRDLSLARHIRISTGFQDRRHTTAPLVALTTTAFARNHPQPT